MAAVHKVNDSKNDIPSLLQMSFTSYFKIMSQILKKNVFSGKTIKDHDILINAYVLWWQRS